MAELRRIPGLQSKIARTRWSLRALSIVRAFWPLGLVAAGFLILTLAGGHDRLGERNGALVSAIAAILGLGALVYGFLRYRDPERTRAIDLLDRQSDLRPLTTLADRPSRPDLSGAALWRAYEPRLMDAARRLSVPEFRREWRALDPLWLRVLLPLAVIALLIAFWPQAGGRLQRAVAPDLGMLFGADRISIQAWITPPDYTGRAPIFLEEGTEQYSVPAGSVLTVRANAPSAPELRLVSEAGSAASDFGETPEGAYEVTAELNDTVSAQVHWWGERAGWQIAASGDMAPEVQWTDTPELGEGDKTEFGWSVSDDHGVASLELSLRPVSPGWSWARDHVDVPMGPVLPKEASETSELDLTRHRLAGLEVEARLVATDEAGQTARSEPVTFELPEKLFLQPMARAIQDVRVTVMREDAPYGELPESRDALRQDSINLSATQRVMAAPEGIRRAVTMLEAITYRGDRYFEDIVVYTGLAHSEAMLETSGSLDEAGATEPLLWALALRAEYGTAADALKALQAAREALEEALRDGASEAEIRRRMEAFKQAAQNYLAARMAEAIARGLDAPPDDTDSARNGGGQSLGGQDFSDMLSALEDLTETGASDQARQLLSDITNMLENLEFQQGQSGSGGFPGLPGEEQGEGGEDQDIPEGEQEMSDALRELSELLRQQRELNDETMAEQRGERGGNQSGNQPGGEPNGRPNDQAPGEGGGDLADRQDELGGLVDEFAERLGQLGEDGEGMSPGDERTLEQVERAQRRASRALREGDMLGAGRFQDEAARGLRDLAEDFAGELDQMRAARLGEEWEEDDSSEATDPFGNPMGGVNDSRSVDIPDEAERQRAKDILEELRRRYGRSPDESEREYLERLLDRF